MASRAVEVAAHGKINLILRILDRRPDAYHNLWSVMQTFELADTVTAEIDDAAGIHLTCEGADLPEGSSNLAYQAAERMLSRLNRRDGIRLLLRKRLPVSAGVGGGSSDAAATIRALAVLWETGWSPAEMAAVGQELGSDVPFFFYGPTALVEGRGERVSPLQLEGDRWLLLVNPGVAIPTAWAYGKLAAARADRPLAHHPPSLAGAMARGETPVMKWDTMLPLMENDFEPVMEREHPVLREIRLGLLESGAEAAMLCGSGSTVFGVFTSEPAARTAARGLGERSSWRTWVTRTQGQPAAVSARLTT